MEVSDWIKHRLGDPIPVDPETMVMVRQDNGDGEIWEDDSPIRAGYWDHEPDPEGSNWATTEPGTCNIIAYRIVTP